MSHSSMPHLRLSPGLSNMMLVFSLDGARHRDRVLTWSVTVCGATPSTLAISRNPWTRVSARTTRQRWPALNSASSATRMSRRRHLFGQVPGSSAIRPASRPRSIPTQSARRSMCPLFTLPAPACGSPMGRLECKACNLTVDLRQCRLLR